MINDVFLSTLFSIYFAIIRYLSTILAYIVLTLFQRFAPLADFLCLYTIFYRCFSWKILGSDRALILRILIRFYVNFLMMIFKIKLHFIFFQVMDGRG